MPSTGPWPSVPVPPAPAVRRNRILVMDDEPGVRLSLRRYLEAHGFDVEEARSCREAEDAFRAMPPDAAILDHCVPDGSGVDLVPRLKELSPSAPIVVLTGHGSSELAVRAITGGAEQFLTKPIELPALQIVLERLLEGERHRQMHLAGVSRQAREAADPFVGASEALRRLVDDAREAACSDDPVLIEGEAGSGKGVLARWLHASGPRRDEPFVDLNCAATAPELLEGELFGREGGTAGPPGPGALELAHHGTLFLDEIGALDLPGQVRLLPVPGERRFQRLGESRERHVDVRLVAASRQDLSRLAVAGRFHRDLHLTLSARVLRLPPLRERPQDLPALAAYLLDRCAQELGRCGTRTSPEALALLQQHHWPGNVRELRNVLERALLLAPDDEVRPQDLRAAMPPAGAAEGVVPLEELERRGIVLALDAERGHVGRAALRLGVPRSSLYKMIKRYGLVAGSR
jgi:DNA-binding NtrC family response regulator